MIVLILIFSVNMKNWAQYISVVPCFPQASMQQVAD